MRKRTGIDKARETEPIKKWRKEHHQQKSECQESVCVCVDEAFIFQSRREAQGVTRHGWLMLQHET